MIGSRRNGCNLFCLMNIDCDIGREMLPLGRDYSIYIDINLYYKSHLIDH